MTDQELHLAIAELLAKQPTQERKEQIVKLFPHEPIQTIPALDETTDYVLFGIYLGAVVVIAYLLGYIEYYS